MGLLFAIFTVFAIGFAGLLGAALIGRLLVELHREVRFHRLTRQRLVIEQMRTNELLLRLVAEKYAADKAKKPPSAEASAPAAPPAESPES
jgi:hypothetical protein